MKIALITPYGGTNLGDAAIQEAVIYHIKKRYPSAVICMVTLNPEKTSKLHNVASYPITSLTIAFYSTGCSPSENNKNCHDKYSTSENLTAENILIIDFKSHIKKIPWLFSFLKYTRKLLLNIVRLPVVIYGEISHFYEACKVMKGADFFLVSGGGQIDDYWGGPWGHPYSLFKWGLISKIIGARYKFLGVGTCTLESKLSSRFIRWALSLASYRSYRDETSKFLLKDLSFTHQDTVCPDLAWSFDRQKFGSNQNKNNNTIKIVGVSPIAFLRHNWPKKDITAYETYLKNLAMFTESLIKKGYSIVFFSSDGPDRHAIRELIEKLESKSMLDAHRKVNQICTENLSDLFACLATVDYVVASRLHGVIFAHLAQKPVLGISYDRKVKTYMQDVGLSNYCFDIHMFNSDLLEAAFENIISESNGIEKKLAKIGTEYANQLNHQYDRILRS